MGNKVIAVVVTYNRKELLKECIDMLLCQTYKDFKILIIDNNSTDGTEDFIKEYIDNGQIIYKNTQKNIGGAGGFNFGIKEACKIGCENIWLMDDDTIPQSDALENLIEADNMIEGNYGFLSSTTLWTDGTPCKMNKQKLVKDWYNSSQYLKDGIIETYYATFVSFFTKIDVVKEVGLPIKEFFIWGDDVEYSNRISKKYKCYIAGKSQVIHKIKDNNGSNIAKENGDRINRYKYAYRNECYIARKNGFKGVFRQIAKIIFNILRVLFTNNKHKVKKIGIILGASIKGIFFRPKIEYVGEKND